MANNQSTFVLKLETKGMPEAQRSSKEIRENLEGAQKAASATKVARSAAAMPTGAAGASAGISGEDVVAYNRAAGAAGKAGGSARDFADQARGLGGLVRLYATFAANIFAATAAFGALSRAMDTTNMIKGLDMLGAASGRNLGQLSKRLVEATDGAISLRDAMEAVAKGSAAGMTGKNLERLAVVAKNASLALGISMPDAMNRLSRGVSKLEPELLDELGIFTKIEPAVQAYAREVGKSASQLTDFEKRQAFANAVIKEGEEKFSALAAASANPYDKLLASLKNVSQSGLELVNKVLTPVVNLLASSPTGLALALGGIAALLVRQAIPAIGQVRAGLAKAADESVAAAQGKAGEALAARQQLNKLIESKVEASADAQVKAVDAAEKRMLAIQKDSINQRGAVYKLLKKDIVDIEQTDIDAAERRYARIKNDPTRKEEAAASRQVIDGIKGQIAAEADLRNVKEKNRQQIQQDAKSWSVFGIVQQKAADYELKAKKQAIVSNAAYNASLIGVSGAVKLMNVELEASGLKLGKVGTAALYARAGLAVLAGAAATVISGLNKFLGIIGILTTAFSMLSTFASKNGKEMNAFDSAVEGANSSVENINRTLDVLKAKGGFATASIEGIMAMANAFGEAADSAQSLLSASIKAKDAANGWDKLWDGIFSFFGGGIDKNLAKSLSSQLVSMMDILRKSDLSEKYQKTFKEILNVGSLDFETVSAALAKADQSVREKFIKSLQEARTELANTASRLEGFKAATEGLTKSYQEFIQSTASSDPLFKVGAALEKFALESQKVALGGVKELEAAFIDLAKSPEKVATLGSAFTTQFVSIKEGFLDQIAVITQYKELLAITDKDIAKFSKSLADLPDLRTEDVLKKRKELTESLEKTTKFRESLLVTIDLLPRDKIEAARGLFVQGIEISFAKSAELIKTALGNAAEAAKLTIQKAKIGVLSGELRAVEENKLALRQIDIQIEAVKINLALIDSQEKLAATINEANAIATEAKLKENPGAKPQELESAKAGRQAAVLFKMILDSGMTIEKAVLEFEKATHEGITPLTRALIKQQLSPIELRKASQQATLTKLGGERTAQEITGGREIRAQRAADLEKIRVLNDNITQQESTRLGILQSITGVQSEYLTKQQAIVDNALMESRFAAELKALRDKATEAQGQGFTAEAKKIDEEIALVVKRQNAEKDNKGLQDRQKLLQIELDNLSKQQEISKLYRDQYYTSLLGIIDLQGAQNQYNQENLSFSQEYIRQQNYLLEVQRLQTQETRTKAEAEAQYQAQLAIAAARKSVPGADTKAIDAELQRELTKRNIAIATAEQETALRLNILDLQKKSGDEQDRINRLMDTTKSISEGLSAVFGEFGQKLGGLTETLVTVGLQLEKNAKTEKDLRQKQTDFEIAGNYDKVFQIQKEIDQQKQKSLKDEISGNAKIVGSAKNLFKEKTVAYKLLANTEKALHLARLAMDAKELFVKLTTDKVTTASKIGAEGAQTAATQAGAAARTPTYIGEIYAKTFGQLGPILGPAVATGLVALVLSYLGGGSAKQPPGFTAEEQQKVQGTSQYYDSSGKIQTRAGGVLGDATAKSDVVDKGISAIEKHTFENLEFSNKMLSALKAIEKNTKAFTGSLLKAVPGLNVTPETIKSGNWLFGKDTTETLDRGFKIVGTVGQIIDKQAQLLEYTKTKTSSSGFLGIFGGGTSYGGDVKAIDDKGNVLAKNLSNIFLSMGDAISTAAQTIFKDINPQMVMNAFRSLDLTEQLTTSLMGLKGTEAAEAVLSVINSAIDSSVTMLFPTLEKFQEVGESMGDTIIRLANDIRVVTNSLELMGFSLPVLDESVGAVTQAMLDRVTTAQARVNAADAANKIPRQEWQTQGEDNGWWNTYYGTAESAAELAAAQRELKDAQDAVTAATSASTTRNLDLIESLKDALGGEDAFVEKTRFFADNFLSEAERLAPIQRRVTTEISSYASRFPDLAAQMKKVGITTISTRDDFKKLVLSLQDTDNVLNVTTESGQDLFASLMDLAPAFAAVTQGSDAATKALTAEELRNKTLQQQITILDMLGQSESAVAIRRSLEIEELKKYPKEQADILIANQKYIYALEDEQRLKDKLIKQRDKEKQAITSTISSLKSSITTLENFRTSLTGGDKSTLTPIEKYQQAEREFMQLQSIATGTATTEAEKAAQADAISKLPGVAEKFLDASRTVFASSDRYTQDFTKVLGVVDTATGTLKTQKTNAELQLSQLEQTTGFLDTINDNTFTAAQLLQQYLDLQQSNSAAFAGILEAATTSGTNAQRYLTSTTSPLIVTVPVAGAGAGTAAGAGAAAADTGTGSAAAAAAGTGTTVQVTNNYSVIETTLESIEDILRSSNYTEHFLDLRLQTTEIKDDINTYFSTEPLYTPIVAEIRQTNQKLDELKTQVQNLRTEQQAQTGEIITSNAQVTNNTTEQVSQAITEIAESVSWNQRQLVGTPYSSIR